MKQFATTAAEIVRRIVEVNDSDFDEDDDIKDASDIGQEDFWYQIEGDANAWVYGGSWFNPAKKQIVHFDGIEYDVDVEPEEVEIPTSMLAKLPPENPDWRENQERDKIIDAYRIARAEFLNDRKLRTFWTIPADADYLGAYGNQWDKYEEHSPTGIDDESWQRMNLPAKLIELGRYFGMENIGDRFQMSYRQARAMLGPRNI